MKLNLLLCAREVIIDQNTLSASIIGLIDEIAPSAFPVLLPQLAILALFERSMREPDKTKVRVEIASADKVLFSQDVLLDFQGKGRLRQALNFQGFPIEKPGDIMFSVKFKRKALGTYRLTVSQLSPIRPQQPEPDPVSSSTNAAEIKKQRRRKKNQS